jgi:hypothetical protein
VKNQVGKLKDGAWNCTSTRLYKILNIKGQLLVKNLIKNAHKTTIEVSNKFKYLDPSLDKNYVGSPLTVSGSALYEVRALIENGNEAVSHAFNPASDYINALNLKPSSSPGDLYDVLVRQNKFLHGFYRHIIIDLNIVRQVIRFCVSVKDDVDSVTLHQVTPHRISPANYDLKFTTNGNPIGRQSNMLLSQIQEHLEEYCGSHTQKVAPNFKLICKLISNFNAAALIEFVEFAVYPAGKVKYLDLLFKMLPGVDDKRTNKFEKSLAVLSYMKQKILSKQLKDMNLQVDTVLKLKASFVNWKKSCVAKKADVSPNYCDIQFEVGRTRTKFVDSINSSTLVPLTLIVDQEKRFSFKVTTLQAELINLIGSFVYVSGIDRQATKTLFAILDIYYTFGNEARVEKALESKQLSEEGATRKRLVNDSIQVFANTTDQFAVSFAGKSGIQKVEVKDAIADLEISTFESIYDMIDPKILTLDEFSLLQKTDRINIWETVFKSNVKSHISNRRKPCSLFYESYNGTDALPLVNLFNWDTLRDLNYAVFAEDRVRLTVTTPHGNRTFKLKDDVTEGMISGKKKINFNKERSKKTKDSKTNFMEVTSFGIKFDEAWTQYEMKKPVRYVLPNSNNVSSLVNSFGLVLQGGYSKVFIENGSIRLHIPVAEHRMLLSMDTEVE